MPGLYIQTHSMHGLFRGKAPELGRDEDTGGQIIYVLELARALGELKGVDRVDIITRRIVDKDYPGYDKEIEPIGKNANIVRIKCGPDKYIKKVNLWPHMKEFIANVKAFNKKLGRKPDILHSNYADSGYVCSVLSKDLGIPQCHTGHSLGIPKMRKLGVNDKNKAKFNKMFHFEKRVPAEMAAVENSKRIVTSTHEEIEKQYKEYDLDKHHHKFLAIPPGIDYRKFHPTNKGEEEPFRHILGNVVDQYFRDPKKSIVTVLSRMDKRKNIMGLIKAFSQSKEFQKRANLLIIANALSGNDEALEIISNLNKMIRKHDLYGKVAIPAFKLNFDKDVPAYYRFCADRKGVFVNPALIEPFGLTVIEASACGLPVVATKNGGPSEVLTPKKTGMLIDPYDPKDIARKITAVIKDKKLHSTIANNAKKMVIKEYTWEACSRKYLAIFKEAMKAG
jgi:sucrose-phosphate synthase